MHPTAIDKRTLGAAARACAALCLLPLQSALATVQVDQAMTLIKATCSLPNTALELRPTAEGRLEFRITLGNGQRRTVALARHDLDEFTDTAAAQMARLSFDLSGCMEPYFNEAMAGLAGLPDRPTAAPPPAYVPPPLPAPSLPAAPPSAPPPPAYPTTGDLPVSVINNPGLAAPATSGPAQGSPPAVDVAVSFQITTCRAAGRDVVCEVQVRNDTGKDVKLVAQGAYSKLFGEDGSQVQASWAALGNQRADLRWGNHVYNFTLIADTAPVFNVGFSEVPGILTAIKRLEVSVGVQTPRGTDMQKLTQSDMPIQGR